MKLLIRIPDNNIEERKYIIDILLGEFLGITYQIEITDTDNYRLIFGDRELIIEDHFFNKYKMEKSYLTLDALPKWVFFKRLPFIPEKDIPILFGTDKMEISSKRIICGNDIFASSFFMLTRWEEYVNKERDVHNRFSAVSSVAYKNNFLDRPIVNEYVEFLWNMLLYLGIGQKRKERNFVFITTHDVDSIRYWRNLHYAARILGRDLIKQKDLPMFYKNLIEFLQVKFRIRKDPFDTFEYLMDLSEAANIKSRFYFMSGGDTKYDNFYQINEPRTLEIIARIKEREHIIGFHPSFNAYNNPIQWKKEKDLLEEVTGVEVKEGRQHYLRFEAPLTWNIWENNGMEMDCTLSYADREGFRCGTCYEYSVFDFLSRKKLKLKEYPLIVMEASFINYQSTIPEYMEEKTRMLIEITKKYRGNFVYLWHNSSFNVGNRKEYQHIYENILRNH